MIKYIGQFAIIEFKLWSYTIKLYYNPTLPPSPSQSISIPSNPDKNTTGLNKCYSADLTHQNCIAALQEEAILSISSNCSIRSKYLEAFVLQISSLTRIRISDRIFLFLRSAMANTNCQSGESKRCSSHSLTKNSSSARKKMQKADCANQRQVNAIICRSIHFGQQLS